MTLVPVGSVIVCSENTGLFQAVLSQPSHVSLLKLVLAVRGQMLLKVLSDLVSALEHVVMLDKEKCGWIVEITDLVDVACFQSTNEFLAALFEILLHGRWVVAWVVA